MHLVGSVWSCGKCNKDQSAKLRCKKSIKLAEKSIRRSVAFPNINTGVYFTLSKRWPK
ncbi:macro domain-containing protein [Marinifilum sp.]|uniref:macro domain-containing protein n=1 Tax=Marinifilum sp. TaxID=2033137 RepID=UPI003BAA134D